jgi:hypothetical protein
MGVILTKGFIQQGQVIFPKPIDLPGGAEVVVSNRAASDDDGPMELSAPRRSKQSSRMLV